MEYPKLYIKHMVCDRCIMVVRSLLPTLGIPYISVELGEITLLEKVDEKKKEALNKALEELGFSLIDNKRVRLIEQIKKTIIELVHYQNNDLRINLSDYLCDKLHHDYAYLSNLFSEVEGTTIEKFFIAQKIERVKELLVYDELSLGEIAFMLHYSSTAHLSSQFKKVTGLTPSHFKQIKENKRKSLDKI